MKRLLFIGVLLAISSATALATEMESVGAGSATNSAFSFSHYGLWSSRSQAAPAWSFDIEYDKPFFAHPAGATFLPDNSVPETLTFSASRALPYFRSQRLFAAIQASNSNKVRLPAELYQLSNAGMAASFGWQLGDYERFNMAVEYEYREVAEQDINSLLLGVQYYF
ncbi:hypothetical protein IT774_13425 [Salinimonas marina]|uniref:Outer membrane protein beta-barrel domain-containing protein n=1 Tax=Salinimonas marina TaxID=2785918 RepID=A0A7S9HCF7_9ALTE|nr:hypothetical protein [Salinimonas marina]QPG05120.1 hypothetical protein IT774_13425 [Salinimonas marina]